MHSILYTGIYGYPSGSIGGSNRIIYDLICLIDRQKYRLSYLSYDVFINEFIYQEFREPNRINLSIKKKIAKSLYGCFPLYKKIFASSMYMPIHFFRRSSYFNKITKHRNWDIIHAHDSQSMFHLKSSKAKKILSIHSKGILKKEIEDSMYDIPNFQKYSNIFNSMELIAIENSDIIVFPSLAAKEQFIKHSSYDNFSNKDIRIVYNGINVEYINNRKSDPVVLKELKIADNYDLILLNIAAHIKPKNIHNLLETMNILVNKLNKNILLINIGTGPYTSELNELTSRYYIQDNIRFLGQKNNEQVLDIMKMCDVLVMPSERVVFDLVILEALASGICVLASNNGGNTEIIIDGVNGYLLYELNPQYIANKILSVDYKKTIPFGKETIKNFTTKCMVDQYSLMYDEVIKRG